MAKKPDFSPRKAPQQARSKETVDAIFEAMFELFEKRDLGDPTVQTIADRVGVSVGSVYQYFPTKGALVSALISSHLRNRMDELDASLASVAGLSGEQAAEVLVESLLEEKRSRSRIETALLRYFVRAGDIGSLTEMDDRMNASVERFLRALGTTIRPVDTEIAAFVISNALRSAILMSLLQKPERLGEAAFKKELVALVVGYLSAAPR